MNDSKATRRAAITGVGATMFSLLTVAAIAAAPPAAAEAPARGTIFSIGDAQIVVMTAKDTVTYAVSAMTKISLDGKPVRLARLKPGQKVTVTPKTLGGQKIAGAIEARSNKAE